MFENPTPPTTATLAEVLAWLQTEQVISEAETITLRAAEEN